MHPCMLLVFLALVLFGSFLGCLVVFFLSIGICYWNLMFSGGLHGGGGDGLFSGRLQWQTHGHLVLQHPCHLLKSPLVVCGGSGLFGLHPCLLLAGQGFMPR